MSSLAQGSSRSFDFIPQSPLGPSGHTRSRQKTIGESVEKEKGKASFLSLSLSLSLSLFCTSSLFLLCLSLSLLIDEWSFLSYSPNASQAPREARVSHLVMMWYDLLPLVPFTACFHSFLVLCTYAFFDVLPHTLLFLLQVEVPSPTTSGTLVKEVMTTTSTIHLGVEKEPLMVM